jgi:hypothetical protein
LIFIAVGSLLGLKNAPGSIVGFYALIVPGITQKACKRAHGLGTARRLEQRSLLRMPNNLRQLRLELECRVLARTGRRVLNLDIELLPERIVLHGRAGSYHIKQLAQQGVRECLPNVRLENAIEVGA